MKQFGPLRYFDGGAQIVFGESDGGRRVRDRGTVATGHGGRSGGGKTRSDVEKTRSDLVATRRHLVLTGSDLVFLRVLGACSWGLDGYGPNRGQLRGRERRKMRQAVRRYLPSHPAALKPGCWPSGWPRCGTGRGRSTPCPAPRGQWCSRSGRRPRWQCRRRL